MSSFGAFRDQGVQPGLPGRTQQRIAQSRRVKRRKLLRARIQLVQEEARLGQLVGVNGVVQQIDSLLGSQFVVWIRVRHMDAFKGRFVREEKTVIECIASIDVVAQHDVRQLEGKDCSEVRLIRQHVDQALAENDGVANRQRFERGGKQDAAVNRIGNLNVVADDDIVGHLFQDLVKVAGRRQQSCLHQAVEDVLLCLGNPLPLCLQRAEVRILVALILHVVDLDRLVVRLVGGQLQAVAPDIGLGLERDWVL